MAKTRLFTYNSGAPISGATQYGNIAIADLPVNGYTWWAGPDENLGYIIAHEDTNPNVRTERKGVATISTNSVGFWGTSTQSDASFLTMVNGLFSATYSNAFTAASWLNTNGYWTSWAGLAGSLSFNGTNQSLSISPGITFGSGAFTVEGWFYNISNFNNRGVMGSPVTSPIGCLNLHFTSNTSFTSDKNGGGGSRVYTMSSAITTNVWHYLIYNRNADGTTAVYIDGVRAGSAQSDTLNYNTATDMIGRDYAGYWPGYWTNMRITTGSAVYDSNQTTQVNPVDGGNKPIPLTSLANTKYLMLAINVTTDTSGNQTVTNNNGVSLSSSKPS